MFDFRKAGMLIVLLAFPAFFFLFLRTCGTNHYDLPYFHPVTDSDGHVTLNGADTVYYQVSGVLGITPGGDTVTSQSLEGKITAFYLGGGDDGAKESRLSEDKGRLLEILANEKDFQLLERTWDRDEEIGGGPAPVKIRSGSSAESWEEVLKIGGKPGPAGTLYANSSLVLVDGEGYIRGYYDLSDTDDFDRALAEIKILSYQKKIAEK